MRLSETQELFGAEFDYPVDREHVLAAVGDVELDAPAGDSETIGDSLARTDVVTFESQAVLYDSLVSTVSDAYIGRKYYDDRGDNPGYHELSD